MVMFGFGLHCYRSGHIRYRSGSDVRGDVMARGGGHEVAKARYGRVVMKHEFC